MKIHHIRNATMVIEIADKVILIDPMLGKKGSSAPPFTFFRFKPKRNPTVELPNGAMDIISRATHCLLTHLHPDHLDGAAVEFLKARNLPVICSEKDEKNLRKRGLNVTQTLKYWEDTPFLGGTIRGIPARHGYGFIAKPMGNVMGFFLQFPQEKSIYLSSDTIYTDDVHTVLTKLKPDIAVVASGSAQFDIFQPLLMRMEDILKFVQNAPNIVIANHLEAVNHCPTTRVELGRQVAQMQASERVFIPEDGEVLAF